MPPVKGRVLTIDHPHEGPIIRPLWVKVLRVLLFATLVPLALLAGALIKLTWSLTASLTGAGRSESQRGFFAEYLNDMLAHLSAERILQAGKTSVQTIRIRTTIGNLISVRLEGHVISGALRPGDDVELLIRVIEGVNIVTSGNNLTTKEAIRLHH